MISTSAGASKTKDVSKHENPSRVPFIFSKANENSEQSSVTRPSPTSFKNQKTTRIVRNRSKSSSLSDNMPIQMTSFESGSSSRTNLIKVLVGSCTNTDNGRVPFAPSIRNDQNRRRSLSSNNFDDTETAPIKNSMVITNSRLVPEFSQNQTLSSITFNDKICVALPQKLTIQELHECPSHRVRYLLEKTRELNVQLKKRKKRSKKPCNRVNTESVRNLGPEIKDNHRKRAVEKPIQPQKIQSTSNTLRPSKQFSPSELLNLRAQCVRDNLEIISKVKKLNINTDQPPVCELIKEKTMVLPKPPVTAFSPKFMKQLMKPSWFDLDENAEEKNSRQIYENLKQLVLTFDKNEEVINDKNPSNEKPIKKKAKKKLTDDVEAKNKTEEDPTMLVFEDHYELEKVERGLRDGSLFKDNIRINQKNYKEAYLFCPYDGRDIFIDGVRDRNRALEGDEVVIELHSEEKWKVHTDDSVQKSGKVVFILQKNHPRTAVGYLKMIFKKNKIDKILLCPRDCRIPRIKIPVTMCPANFKSDFKRYENYLYEGKILKWDNVAFAEGIIIQELGEHNDLETETRCILLENHLDVEPFENYDEYLSSTDDTIPENEIRKRVDLRTQCVFTIDPIGAKDLDDALSCVELQNGNFEVGVHIADVTHYLLPDTPLDENVRKKATSVYLTQKVFHMLPHKLCDLCSLTPSADKLAFSLFVELDRDGEIVNHRFAKTVVRSCAQFAYHHAQEIMDKDEDELNAEHFPTITNGFTFEDCSRVINNLQLLARIMRKRRFDGGALKIDQPKILFELDESSFPISYSLFHPKESNWLIEEFMLLANILTANRLREKFPDLALLRCHSPPNEKSLSYVVENLEKIGIYIDMTNAGSIYRSMTRYDGFDEIGIARMAVIINLLVKPMSRACYICSTAGTEGDNDFWHYALNVPYYTHFTSPIRRYADIVVHRLLACSLGYCEMPNWLPDDIQQIAENCNRKKNSAKKASEVSSELFLRLYMEKYGPIKVRAVVIEVKERYFDVIDFSTRTTNRVYVDKIKPAKVKFENDKGVHSHLVTWKCDGDVNVEQIIQIFTVVDVQLAYNKLVNKVTVTLLKPSL